MPTPSNVYYWYNNLGADWSTVSARQLKSRISVARTIEPTPESSSSDSANSKKSRGRPRTKKERFYCPHCKWLKTRGSRTGSRGRKGNARQHCMWCLIWTKQHHNPRYVLTSEEEQTVREEDNLWTDVWAVQIARRNFGIDEDDKDDKSEGEEAREEEAAKVEAQAEASTSSSANGLDYEAEISGLE